MQRVFGIPQTIYTRRWKRATHEAPFWFPSLENKQGDLSNRSSSSTSLPSEVLRHEDDIHEADFVKDTKIEMATILMAYRLGIRMPKSRDAFEWKSIWNTASIRNIHKKVAVYENGPVYLSKVFDHSKAVQLPKET